MQFEILLTKATKALKKIAKRVIPKNKRYRPVSVQTIELSELSTPISYNNIVVHSIYPQHLTTLDITEDLYQACSEYWKPQRSVITDYVVVEVLNGRLHTDNESSIAIITKDNKLVDNVSLSLKDGKVTKPENNNIFSQQMFSEPVRLQGNVFTMLSGGAGINNIGHWFLDVLPRLHLLQQSGLFDQIDWFLVPSTRYSYQTETLELLGISKEKIISGETHTHIVADKIIASTAPRGNHTLVPKWLITYMREAFLPAVPTEEQQPVQSEGPFLFISRRDSSVRNILNEDELQQVLGHYGFNTILSSKLSITDKIKLFSKAKVILSPTGAGLISMLFCQPGTKLVEIFNEGFVIEPFFDIATKLELDYKYIICKSQGRKATNAKQGQHDHLVVETEKVEQLLEQIVEPEKTLSQALV
ncbi:glycosyltransferase family 61 protein [Pontibacter sp. KCTC 32443]|uniref:glycosyltransferase family 61 protein n=1 Tax=Pontibacter TaxID=323449 RepID=UPI00164D5432|nr:MULTISPECIES: glycosyltransferase family 61 protein [Pontibacter]MBC5773091.1 glycosyltransferase family 61 protein [Pontibacter sp. KCTC 32443]